MIWRRRTVVFGIVEVAPARQRMRQHPPQHPADAAGVRVICDRRRAARRRRRLRGFAAVGLFRSIVHCRDTIAIFPRIGNPPRLGAAHQLAMPAATPKDLA